MSTEKVFPRYKIRLVLKNNDQHVNGTYFLFHWRISKRKEKDSRIFGFFVWVLFTPIERTLSNFLITLRYLGKCVCAPSGFPYSTEYRERDTSQMHATAPLRIANISQHFSSSDSPSSPGDPVEGVVVVVTPSMAARHLTTLDLRCGDPCQGVPAKAGGPRKEKHGVAHFAALTRARGRQWGGEVSRGSEGVSPGKEKHGVRVVPCISHS